MKTSFKILGLALAISSGSAWASGGMIGGGEVSFKTLLTCKAAGIDSTFPQEARQVSIVKEVDFNGTVIADANLRVVTLDANERALRYFVTHTPQIPASTDWSVGLEIFRYENDSRQIGNFYWNEQSKTGQLSVHNGQDVTELQLKNCRAISQ